MSKRKALSAPVGVRSLMKEVKLLERAGFIVDVDEANAKSWHIALEPKLLKQHGLGTLIGDLNLWAGTARKPSPLCSRYSSETAIPLSLRLSVSCALVFWRGRDM